MSERRPAATPRPPRRSWAEVDLDAIAENYRAIRSRVGPRVRVCAVVKADAYGHGAAAVAERLAREPADAFAVADVGEALTLRAAGCRAPILALYPPMPDEVEALVAADCVVAVGSADLVAPLAAAAARRRRPVEVHLVVDTGMGRGGVEPSGAPALARALAAAPGLRVGGAYTHFAAVSAADPASTLEPYRAFERACDAVVAEGIPLPCRHAANSAATFVVPRTHGDLVRPGIALYGVDPGVLGAAGVRLRPALSWRTRIVAHLDIAPGTTIGYRPGFTTYRPTRIAVLPIGYADGYPYALGNRGRVLVRGVAAPVVGQISMDCTAVDVGDVPGATTGDVVTLVGRDGAAEVRFEDLAATVGTIPYEIAARLGPRVERRYLGAAPATGPAGSGRRRRPPAP